MMLVTLGTSSFILGENICDIIWDRGKDAEDIEEVEEVIRSV